MNNLPVIHSDNYALLMFRKLWEELPQLIVGGLFFSLLALPAFVLLSIGWLFPAILVSIVTLAPAWAALLAYELPLVNNKVTRASFFWQALRRYIWRSIGLGMIAAFPLLSALLKLPLLRQSEIPRTIWLSFSADFFAGGLIAALLLYAFPLLVRNNQNLRPILRDAWFLIGRHLGNTLGLLGMLILFGFAVSSISLGLLFLLPAVYALFIVGNCELVQPAANDFPGAD